jgi:hypothetical protein
LRIVPADLVNMGFVLSLVGVMLFPKKGWDHRIVGGDEKAIAISLRRDAL